MEKLEKALRNLLELVETETSLTEEPPDDFMWDGYGNLQPVWREAIREAREALTRLK